MAAAAAAAADDDDDERAQTARRLLDRAWSRIAGPTANILETQAALADVLAAVTLCEGQGAVTRLLDKAKSDHAAQQAAAEEEARARRQIEQRRQELRTACASIAEDACEQFREEPSLLRERGKESLLLDAFRNQSSVVCAQCSQLISRDRWPQHAALWCPALADDDDDDDDK